MQHFVDFGYIKQANKQLKKINELSKATGEGDYPKPLGQLAKQTKNVEYQKEYLNRQLRQERRKKIYKQDPLSFPVSESRDLIRTKKLPLPEKDWSDIRKTNDGGASTTGYLGFRKDPFKGYGGMMEEEIPFSELYGNGSTVVRKRVSRISGNPLNYD